MDTIDTQMLAILRENARTPAAAIARQVNLSVPAVLERIRKLTQSGIVERFTVKLNRKRSGLTLLAFIQVRLIAATSTDAFRRSAVAFACVLECHHIAGEYDYLLKVAAPDTAALEAFLTEILKQIDGVAGTNTLIVLTTLKEEFNA